VTRFELFHMDGNEVANRCCVSAKYSGRHDLKKNPESFIGPKDGFTRRHSRVQRHLNTHKYSDNRPRARVMVIAGSMVETMSSDTSSCIVMQRCYVKACPNRKLCSNQPISTSWAVRRWNTRKACPGSGTVSGDTQRQIKCNIRRWKYISQP